MAREPLIERSGQGQFLQHRRKFQGSQKRAYGKGSAASSRAVLCDLYLDENEIEEQLSKISLGQVALPPPPTDGVKPVPFATAVPGTRNGRKTRRIVPLLADQKADEPNLGNQDIDLKATEYTYPLRAECHKSKDLCDFSAWADKVARAFKVTKVGEGSYGEVFKLEKRDVASLRAAVTPQPDRDSQAACIFKLIPLRAKGSRSNNHTSLDDVLREVQMLKLLDPIPGFARFRDCTVLQGSYPPSFAAAYHEYKALQESLSTFPSRYSHSQLWVMIEMDDGGTDLESLVRPSAYQVFDIFWSTCSALSYAEAHAEFEHRDLHIGNICIKRPEVDGAHETRGGLNERMQSHGPHSSNFGYSGLRTTVIDYTLSRATYARFKNKSIIYHPFKQTSIFKGNGKTPEERVQYETYRKMHAHAHATEQQSHKEGPGRKNKKLDKWARFMPRTNVMWLAYLLFTLLYRSGSQELEGSNEVAKEVQGRIYQTLEKIQTMLAGEREWNAKPPQSATDTIAMAHKGGLLAEEDLKAIKESLERNY